MSMTGDNTGSVSDVQDSGSASHLDSAPQSHRDRHSSIGSKEKAGSVTRVVSVTPATDGDSDPDKVSPQPDATSVTPGQPDATSVTPQQPDATSVTPGQPDATSVTPGQPDAASVTPGQPDATSVTPGQPDTTSVTPGQPEATSITQTGEPQTSSVAPGQPDATSVTPGQPDTCDIGSESGSESSTECPDGQAIARSRHQSVAGNLEVAAETSDPGQVDILDVGTSSKTGSQSGSQSGSLDQDSV